VVTGMLVSLTTGDGRYPVSVNRSEARHALKDSAAPEPRQQLAQIPLGFMSI